jgi:hypothetical protein
MPEILIVRSASAVGSYPGPLLTPPAAPAVAASGLPAGAPTLTLGLTTIRIIVAGDIIVGSSTPNVTIVRR